MTHCWGELCAIKLKKGPDDTYSASYAYYIATSHVTETGGKQPEIDNRWQERFETKADLMTEKEVHINALSTDSMIPFNQTNLEEGDRLPDQMTND